MRPLKAHSTWHGGFDRWAATYDRSVLQGVFFDRVHGELIRTLRPLLRGLASPRVLDVGCGTGRLLARMRAELPAATLCGVDASPEMVAVAHGKPELQGLRIEVGSAAALPFDDGEFDAVASTVSFHHWEDQPAGLRDVGRVLRPGAILLLLDVYALGITAPLVRRLGHSHGAGMRGEAEVLRMLSGAGLAGVSLQRVGPPLSPLGIFTARRTEVAA
jgi:ubiquinone/menaquinone biosynthesis C-methylase UbiE